MDSYLYQIGVPGIATDVQIVVACFLSGRLPKDVPCGLQSACPRAMTAQAYDISTRARIGLPFGLKQ
jgi:hypothetical protein